MKNCCATLSELSDRPADRSLCYAIDVKGTETGELGLLNKKGELPRLECFHNGIILIVNCFFFELLNKHF